MDGTLAKGQAAGLYLRLSREDDRDGDSQSICNQRDFLLDYCAQQGFAVAAEYIDDGWSGTSFNRPGFLRMLEEIERGTLTLVLTKDLSRLGRDYILTGYYLERYFPEHGVRYIAVNDRIDTGADAGGNDMTPFRAVFNDLYAKDISKKVRTALATRQRLGKFLGTYAPYGYRKDPADGGRLLVVEQQAAQVRQIYAWFLAGETVQGIARRLTDAGIPTPAMERGGPPRAWNCTAVRRMLTLATYKGDLVAHMSQKISYKIDRVRRLPPSEWVVAVGTHKAIVSAETFARAGELLSVRGYRPAGVREPKLLTGLLRCEDCGGSMVLSGGRRDAVYVCSGWKKAHGAHCAMHAAKESAVLDAVRAALAGGTVSPEQPLDRALLVRLIARVEVARDSTLTIHRRAADP